MAQALDAKSKTRLIIENSNSGDYFMIPSSNGEKLIDASAIRVPTPKDSLPEYSLFEVFGKEYKVDVVNPQQLAEKLLKPWVTSTFLPKLPEELYEEIWNEFKDLGKKEEKEQIKGMRDSIEGKINQEKNPLAI